MNVFCSRNAFNFSRNSFILTYLKLQKKTSTIKHEYEIICIRFPFHVSSKHTFREFSWFIIGF